MIVGARSSNVNKKPIMLGLDAEIVPYGTAKNTVASYGHKITPVFPHIIGCPQSRVESGIWKGPYWDWHGDGYAMELCIQPAFCIDAAVKSVAQGLSDLMVPTRYARQVVINFRTFPIRINSNSYIINGFFQGNI